MNQQGDQIVNTEFFDRMIERANACVACEEVKELAKEAIDTITAQQLAITKQLEDLMPMLALLKPPTSLSAIINWAKNFITLFLKPYLQPYITYAMQVPILVAKMGELTAAIQSAADRITTCSLDVDLTLPEIKLPEWEFPVEEIPLPEPTPAPTPAPTTPPTTP